MRAPPTPSTTLENTPHHIAPYWQTNNQNENFVPMQFSSGVPAGPRGEVRRAGRRHRLAQFKKLCGEQQLAKPVDLGEPMYGARVVASPCDAGNLSGDSGTPEVRSTFNDSSKRSVAPLRPDDDQCAPATLAAPAKIIHSLA